MQLNRISIVIMSLFLFSCGKNSNHDANRQKLHKKIERQVISSGRHHTCAIRESDSSVVCWGANDDHQLDVPANLKAVSLSSSSYQTCAVRETDKNLVCWGSGLVPPSDLGGVIAVSIGNYGSCAIKETDRSLECWGFNRGPRFLPPPPSVSGSFCFITVGIADPGACGIEDSGKMTCWGTRVKELGSSMAGRAVLISVGYNFACGSRESDSSVVCRGGISQAHQIGVPTDLGPVRSLVSAFDHTCVIKQGSDQVACWGDNDVGQSNPPVDLGPVEAVSVSENFSCALKKPDHRVICWGNPFSPVVQNVPLSPLL